MKKTNTQQMPIWLARTIVATILLVVAVMPFHAFISTWGGATIGPLWLWKSWKELLLLVVGMITLLWVIVTPAIRRDLARQKIVLAVSGFVVTVMLVTALNAQQNDATATAAGLAMTLRYIAICGLGYLVMKYSDGFDLSRYKKWFIGVAGGVAVLGVLQATILPLNTLSNFGYDKETTIAPYTLVDENQNAPRAFATQSGPNDFAAFLLLPLALTLLLGYRRRPWLIVSGLLLLGLFFSSSRSAWLGAVAMIAVLAVLLWGKRFFLTPRGLVVLASGLMAAVLITAAAVSIPSVRLQVFHSSPGDSGLFEGSTAAHWQASADGLLRVADDPLGCGAGCAGPASSYSDEPRISENYYIQLAEEYGVIGLAFWLMTVVLICIGLYRSRSRMLPAVLLASFVGLSVIGVFLHVWADDPVSLTWWALTGLVIGYNDRNIWAKSRKSKVSSRSKT